MSDESSAGAPQAPDDSTERVECWRCGYMRPTFESCPECGGSCKPLKKKKQKEAADAR